MRYVSLAMVHVPIAPFPPRKGSSLIAPIKSHSPHGEDAETLPGFAGLVFTAGANRRAPMDEYTKAEIWDLAAGTFIAVSVVSGVAYIIASAIY